MIRAYGNPVVSLKAGYEQPLFRWGGTSGGWLISQQQWVLETIMNSEEGFQVLGG